MNFDAPKGASPLDPDELEGLKLSHITTREELNRWEQENILDAYDWLERRRSKEVLDVAFIRTLHKKMFDKVWDWAGKYRQTDKNIGIQWGQIPTTLRNFLDDVKYWIANDTYEKDEIATRFHHRLVQIHLFPNGNGRHARLITDYLLEQKLDSPPFTWGSGNLILAGDVRDRYISALQAADLHNYQPLLDFVRS